MFQDFTAPTRPEQGPPRLARLRAALAQDGLDGFIVPRADAYQGEYVAPRDERLSWLTGFTGSAGFAVVLADKAGVFVDGRYREQVRSQVAECYTPVDWPETSLGDWLLQEVQGNARIGFDPWLHTVGQIETLEKTLRDSGIAIVGIANPIDRIWDDQPAPPALPASAQPLAYAGLSHGDKRAALAATLKDAGQASTLLTQPDSIAWLLNIRGHDIPRNPIVHGFALLHADASVDLFMDPVKLEALGDHLGAAVRVHSPDMLRPTLQGGAGPIRLDKATTPVILAETLTEAGIAVQWGDNLCALPKARKNAAELAGTTEAHLRDGAAVCDFLAWFDEAAETGITEIDVVRKLEDCRRATGDLLDISFDTIAGSGPHGAVIHYRVTQDTNRMLATGDLLVLDSGGQYRDGTTDITRTLPVGAPGKAERDAFTRVLKGMIAISRLRWPRGLAGQHLEAIGRAPLWQAGLDFDHGLGHGVGVYLCVHEGPQRFSRLSDVPLEPGMILSNEPGYYRPGAFGIRIENLVTVEPAPVLEGGDAHRSMLCLRTLTYCPIDRRLIAPELLTKDERDWLNTYHETCRRVLSDRVAPATEMWLYRATAPL
ncbi:MAG: aminopeptidase P family protein [Rhodobacteraceae bacterium]|nr:aminopeptidase P family protein [Paracoccaceae bacterium]MCW9043621.1 aminopeptidase P family protein [Pseudopelagicola sp.]